MFDILIITATRVITGHRAVSVGPFAVIPAGQSVERHNALPPNIQIGYILSADGSSATPPIVSTSLIQARRYARISEVYLTSVGGVKQHWAVNSQHGDAVRGTLNWYFHQAELSRQFADQLNSDAPIDNQFGLIAVSRIWYEVMLGNTTLRTQWANASVATGSPLYSDAYNNDGSARTINGDFNVISGKTFAANFNPDLATLGVL